MLEKIMLQYDLSLDIEATGAGIDAFLRLYRNGDSYLIEVGHGKTIVDALQTLERVLATRQVEKMVEFGKAVL